MQQNEKAFLDHDISAYIADYARTFYTHQDHNSSLEDLAIEEYIIEEHASTPVVSSNEWLIGTLMPHSVIYLSIIKSGSGKKYALMAYSSSGGIYGVKLTTDDFNNGQNTGSGKFYNQEVGISSLSETYPSITVLKDGTICTLAAEETNEIVFRRFELKWLMNEY